jgi:membrane protease YdiL (CAAX protease family)
VSRPWAIAELLIAIAISLAALAGYVPYAATPWLLAAAAFFLWWRGPGWRAIGLRRPVSWTRTVLLALAVASYQFVGTYFVEPLIARVTTGDLPDVSVFRPLVGDEQRLLIWLAISWTLAAFMEEMVYRGWLTARIAELTYYSRWGWVAALCASSALFGLAHLYQGTSGVVATAITGFIFGAAYLFSGRNLWCAILAHGLLDTIGFVMIYLGVYPGL